MTSPIAPPKDRRERALQHEVLRVTGPTLAEGDRREVGIFVDTPEDALGVVDYDATIIIRGSPGERPKADLTLHSLRYFLSLAAEGDPSALAVLWAPPEAITKRNGSVAPQLLAFRDNFVTRDAGRRFLGYLDFHVEQLRSEAGGAPYRPALIARHGYDTKSASRALGIGWQGVELMQHARLTLPMDGEWRDRVLAVKRGDVPLADAMKQIERVRATLVTAIDHPDPTVRDRANVARISMWSATMHQIYWTSL